MLKNTENFPQKKVNSLPLISVIIPIYNLEKYIDDCLKSVTEQTYTNLEILIVNDGSTDLSGEKCAKWAEQDSRIVYINKGNGGAASARNAALDVCKGDLYVFVDGDDGISPEYIQILYNHLAERDADIAICGWVDRRENEHVEAVGTGKDCFVYDKTEALRKLLYQEEYDTAMWCKLYKRELFEGLRFQEGNIYEDIELIYKVFERAASVVYTPYTGYFYLLRESGTTLKSFSVKKMDLIDVVEEMDAYLCGKYPELAGACASKFVRANFHIYLQIPRTEEFEKERTRIENNINRYRKNVIKDPRVRKGTKAALILSGISYGLFYKLKELKSLGK